MMSETQIQEGYRDISGISKKAQEDAFFWEENQTILPLELLDRPHAPSSAFPSPFEAFSADFY